jgi:hypothetical protein
VSAENLPSQVRITKGVRRNRLAKVLRLRGEFSKPFYEVHFFSLQGELMRTKDVIDLVPVSYCKAVL